MTELSVELTMDIDMATSESINDSSTVRHQRSTSCHPIQLPRSGLGF